MWERVSFTSHPSQSKIGCQSWSDTNVGKCLIFVNIWSDPVSAIDYIQPIIFTPKVKMRETAEEKRTMYSIFWKRTKSNCMQTFSDFSDWTECSKLTNLLTLSFQCLKWEWGKNNPICVLQHNGKCLPALDFSEMPVTFRIPREKFFPEKLTFLPGFCAHGLSL